MTSLIPLSTRLGRFDDMFPEVFRRFMHPTRFDVDMPEEMRVDVTETDKEYMVWAEVPGVKKEDIHVSVNDNYVSISTEIKQEKEEKSGGNGARTLFKEIYHGSTSRSFTLAHDVDEKAAVVKYEDGILKMTLPKRKESISKELRIQ